MEPPGAGASWHEVRRWRKALRSLLIERRLAIPAADRADYSAAITAALLQHAPVRPGATLGFYWPMKGEFDPRPLARQLHGLGVNLALPVVVTANAPMQFRTWRPGTKMIPGIWNIPVPEQDDPVSPNVLLAPLVGFDKQRYRLGYGGGYFDRTLAASSPKPVTIGVGFDLCQIPSVFPQPHDQPMDLIVTESRAG